MYREGGSAAFRVLGVMAPEALVLHYHAPVRKFEIQYEEQPGWVAWDSSSVYMYIHIYIHISRGIYIIPIYM